MFNYKKIACTAASVAILSVGGLCSASDGGDLTAQQKTADVFIDAVDGNGAPEYKDFVKGFSDDLKNNFNQAGYSNLQRQVKTKFGTLKDVKFFKYERYDQGDQLTYIASFDAQQLSSMVFVFDTNKKLANFAIVPLNEQAEQETK